VIGVVETHANDFRRVGDGRAQPRVFKPIKAFRGKRIGSSENLTDSVEGAVFEDSADGRGERGVGSRKVDDPLFSRAARLINNPGSLQSFVAKTN
jgi:hypothetical protein